LQNDADADPAYHFDEDLDADPDRGMRIRIGIFIWCVSGCGSRLPKWCGSIRIHNTEPGNVFLAD